MQAPLELEYDVIIGHGPGCTDGATAMWTVWRQLSPDYRARLAAEGGFYSSNSPYKIVHPNSVHGGIYLQQHGFPIVFVFVQPNTPIDPELVNGKRVLILDLDLGDHLIPVVEHATSVCVCDHHNSTLDTLHRHATFLDAHSDVFTSHIDTSLKASGATLAWNLFYCDSIPPFVDIVRIGDNWAWDDHPHLEAKAVLHSLFERQAFRSFDHIEHVYQTWDDMFETYVNEGRTMLKYEMSLVNQVAKQCDIGYMEVEDGTVYTVAYVQANFLRSEIGASMRWIAEKKYGVEIDFCATWNYIPRKKLVSVSLRDPKESLDLALIARTIKNTGGNGGGHIQAAGFSFYGLDRFEQYIQPVHPS